MRYFIFVVAIGLYGFAAAVAVAQSQAPDAQHLQAMSARFAPVDIRADLSALPPSERHVLQRLVAASQIINVLYLRQTSAQSEAVLLGLLRDAGELGRARLHNFWINKGPWSEFDENRPFLPGVGERPPAGNYYPADATRAEVDAWFKSLPDFERLQAQGFFTTIRRAPNGSLVAVPYSVEYQGELAGAARLLREAAAETAQPSLKVFLEKRAAAFLSNDYYDSDLAWMDIDATIEPTIGPYEVYADQWFNYKAAFEAYIAVTDAGATAKLAGYSQQLQGLQDHLPIAASYRRSDPGRRAPIRVVNVVLTAGDGDHGSQTAAFNLPNDERVVAAKGSKRVMLKNIQEGKFEKVLLPIGKIILAASDQAAVGFDAFFTHILMHELMHGLGPQTIRVAGRDTTVRQELKELNGTLEEAKADISGLWALQYLMDKGVLDKQQERAVYVTFLASAFRTLRFGLTESHAQGMALQLNYLLDHGGVVANRNGTFAIDLPKIKTAVTGLTHDIMTLQARGDYAGTQALLKRMVVLRPEVQLALDRLTGLPVDIEPKFVTADELAASL
jgi:hypothetical protein